MGVPTSGELTMLKIARERKGYGYTSGTSITAPIYLSDLSRLTGGNSSGSGESYPSINTLNPADERPDGSNPLQMSEFYGYEQNVTLVAFYFIYDSGSSGSACAAGLPDPSPYYHNDSNNLYPSQLNGYYTAYINTSGTTASAGYYQVFDSSFNSTGKYIQVGSGGSIIGGGSC